MRNMTVQDLVKTAKAIRDNEDIVKDNLEITYKLRPDHHRRLNEEVHYRITNNKEELKYSKTFEVNLFDINFKLIADE